jgi:hypothetical protein
MNKRQIEFRFRKLTAFRRLLPDFLIIGAQKAGTTSLYSHLTQHPCVGAAFEKEVRYFNDHYTEGADWYRAHFPTKRSRDRMMRHSGLRLVTGEGEPSYLPNPVAAQRVMELLPDVRLIVMLRDPVKRAYSHYQHRFTRNRERRTFEEVCAADKEILKNGWQGLPTGDLVRLGHAHYSYLPRGFYYEQLKSWMSVFPRESFLIIRAEDFFEDTQGIYDDVLEFLDLPNHQLQERKRHNVGKYAEPMAEDTRQTLIEFFRPQNEQLYEFLDRDFGWDK